MMNLMRTDLNLLVLFATLAETRSVSLAAERLALSQPAVSHALARLRRLFDDPLFIRGQGGFILTPRAEALVEPVRAMLEQAKTLLQPPYFDPATSEQVFRLGTSDYTITTLPPQLVRRMRAEAPLTRLELQPMGQLLERLEAGSLDLCFWGQSVPPAPFCNHILFRERLVGALHASHPLAEAARQGTLGLADYLACGHIHVSFSDMQTPLLSHEFKCLGEQCDIRVVAPSFNYGLALLVQTDLLIAVPLRLFQTFARLFDLVSFELPLALEAYDYSLIWHRRTDSDPALRWFRGLIMGIAQENAQAIATEPRIFY